MSKNIFENLKGTVSIGNLKAGTLVLWNMVKDHEAEAWMAVDIAAGVGAVATAIVATVKAVDAFNAKTDEKWAEANNNWEKTEETQDPVDEQGRLRWHREEYYPTKKETLGLTWKYYIPTVALTALSIGGAVSSNKAHEKQYAALAALLTISETQNKDLMAKIEELFGEGSKEKVKEAMFEDKLNAKSDGEFRMATDKEATLYISSGNKVHFEDEFGNEWDSTIPYVEAAIQELNKKMRTESFFSCSVNEFVMMAGGNPGIDKFALQGDNEGWSVSAMDYDMPFEDDPIPIKLKPFINNITKEVAVLVEYQYEPIQHFFEY